MNLLQQVQVFQRRFRKSHIRKLARHYSKRIISMSMPVDDHFIFVALIANLASFMGSPKEQVWEGPFKPKAGADYGNDASLFELGCFTLSFVDKWIFQTQDDSVRRRFMTTIERDFVHVFAEALGLTRDAIGGLLNARLHHYAETDDPSRNLEHVADFIVFAGRNSQPFSGETPPLDPLSFDRFGVLMRLQSWFKAYYELIVGEMAAYLSVRSSLVRR